MKSRLELYWIPLGAGDGIGARVVRFSGGIYERLKALIQRRRRRRSSTRRSLRRRRMDGVSSR